MLKKILTNPYIIAGFILFLVLLGVGVYGVGFTWGESLFGAAALTVLGVGGYWLRELLPW